MRKGVIVLLIIVFSFVIFAALSFADEQCSNNQWDVGELQVDCGGNCPEECDTNCDFVSCFFNCGDFIYGQDIMEQVMAKVCKPVCEKLCLSDPTLASCAACALCLAWPLDFCASGCATGVWGPEIGGIDPNSCQFHPCQKDCDRYDSVSQPIYYCHGRDLKSHVWVQDSQCSSSEPMQGICKSWSWWTDEKLIKTCEFGCINGRCIECPDRDSDKQYDESCGGIDCNDWDSSIYSFAPEICDGKDNDCDDITDNKDEDVDGYISSLCGGSDCDDSNSQVNPGKQEVCDNGKDDDCDSKIDKNDNDCNKCSCTQWSDGECGSGGCSSNSVYQTRRCTPSGCMAESRCVPNPDFCLNLCDSSSFTSCSSASDLSIPDFWDTEAITGMCGNVQYYKTSFKEYCDLTWTIFVLGDPAVRGYYDIYTKWDGSCPSNTNYHCSTYSIDQKVEICEGKNLPPGTYYARVDKFSGARYYNIVASISNCHLPCTPEAEICDGKDNNCNNIVDENLYEKCGSSNVGECNFGMRKCTNSVWSACQGDVGPHTEQCDGKDNDCDGQIDEESDLNSVAPLCENQEGVCKDSKKKCGGNFGWIDCDFQNFGDKYEFIESSCDSLDNDCDSKIDEDVTKTFFRDRDLDGYGNSSDTFESCSANMHIFSVIGFDCNDDESSISPRAEEICYDGLDNNCDSRVDENCQTPPTNPTGLTCNDKTCSGIYSKQIELKCSGSSDNEGDKITYSTEAFYGTEQLDWWNQDWRYRKKIIFSEKAGYERVNEPVRIVFEHNGNADYANNCKDIRVIDENKNEVPYQGRYEDSSLLCNASSAEIWILANAKALSLTNYYIYYGNTNAGMPSYSTTLNAPQPSSSFNINVKNKLDVGIGHCSDNCRICGLSSRGNNLLKKYGSHIVSQDSTDCSTVRLLQNGTIMARYGFDNYFSIPNGQIRVFDKNNILDVVVDDTPQTSELTGGCRLTSDFSGNSAMGCPALIVYHDWVTTYADIPKYRFPETSTLYNIKNSPQGEVVFGDGIYGWHVVNEDANMIKARSPVSETGYAYLSWGNTQPVTQYFFRGFIGNMTVGELQIEQKKFTDSLESSMQIFNEEETDLWHEIGTHEQEKSFNWNVLSLAGRENIKLRCRAVDLEGSKGFSGYYTIENTISVMPLTKFVRGDVNDDNAIDIGDAIVMLDHLFNHVPAICEDAIDANDDGEINIADPVYLLNYLFANGPKPPAPFRVAGEDLTNDTLTC